MLTTISHELEINIGGMPILIRTESPEFVALLQERYGRFAEVKARDSGFGTRDSGREIPLNEDPIPSSELRTLSPSRAPSPERQAPASPVYELNVELIPSGVITEEPDISVRHESRWVIERGDFHAEWDPVTGRGWVRQTPNPYSIDSVLRILHSLVLAREGGFLVHAASAVRNGRAFLFSGISGAGKTTISRLAPADVRLLTDEISYVRRVTSRESGVRELPIADCRLSIERKEPSDSGFSNDHRQSSIVDRQSYEAFGTPFAGELARLGEGLRAPVAALYLLAQGPENRIERLARSDAARALLRNILFFARDRELVQRVFDSVLDFVSRVPVRRLVFAPDARVWDLIG